MYRKFALSIGVLAAVTILAFVAAPLQAQTTPAVAPPTCASHVNALWGSGSEPGSRVVARFRHPSPPGLRCTPGGVGLQQPASTSTAHRS